MKIPHFFHTDDVGFEIHDLAVNRFHLIDLFALSGLWTASRKPLNVPERDSYRIPTR